MQALTFSSGLSSVADPLCRQLAELLSVSLDIEITWVSDRPGEGWMRDSDFDVLWACGFLHASNLATGAWPYRAVAAPVMRPARYGNNSVYFGDVIVRSADPTTSLVALRDRVFAFNERESFSGYQMMLRSPIGGGESTEYTGAAVRTGSHARSIEAVVDGTADWAVIDSTILDMVAHPDIRVMTSLGPYPAPPMLVSSRCDGGLISDLTAALVGLPSNDPAAHLFEAWNVASFVPTNDEPYQRLLA